MLDAFRVYEAPEGEEDRALRSVRCDGPLSRGFRLASQVPWRSLVHGGYDPCGVASRSDGV